MRLAIYVPTSDTDIIEPGSAVVGHSHHDGRVLVYYQGARGLGGGTFADRLLHAAGRLTERYPTVARVLAYEEDLVRVGFYDPSTRAIDVTDVETLLGWLGVDTLSARELEVSR